MDAVETGDALLCEDHRESVFQVLEPKRTCVVLGQSNNYEAEVHGSAVTSDYISILRRRSGGGAVVLAPGMVVTHVVIRDVPLATTLKCFRRLTDFFVEILRTMGISDVCFQGQSDICIGDRKILGSSVYRNQSAFLYHHVLLVNPNLTLLERYLKHPSREPAYRARRSHCDFVTSLAEAGYPFLPSVITTAFQDMLNQKRRAHWIL